MDELKKAGREMDALVAEKVMGCNTRVSRGVREDDVSVMCGCNEEHPHEAAPGTMHYSTDMAAAWQVVEHMRKQSYDFDFFASSCRIIPGWADAVFLSQTDEFCERADTPALAICRAALQAMMAPKER